MDNKVENNDDFDITKHPYLFKVPPSRHPPGITPVGPIVYRDEKTIKEYDNRNNN